MFDGFFFFKIFSSFKYENKAFNNQYKMFSSFIDNMLQNLIECVLRKVELIITMLEKGIQYMAVVVWCPQTFGHIVYLCMMFDLVWKA